MSRRLCRRGRYFYQNLVSTCKGLANFLALGMPSVYWIDITSACNLRCVMCPQSKDLLEPARSMEFGLFKKIIDQICLNRPLVKLYMSGEPLLHKDVFVMIEYAHARGCKTMIHTNATLLTEEVSRRLIDSTLDYLSFSFDGCTPEIYEALRPPAKYDVVEENIKRYLLLQKGRRGAGPYTTVEIIRMKHTERYLKEFTARWKASGCDRVHAQPFITWLDLIPGLEAVPSARYGHKPCYSPFAISGFLPDGTVVPCGMDVRGAMALGRISENTFREIWTGVKYNDMRVRHLTHAFNKDFLCEGCPGTHCRTPLGRLAVILHRRLGSARGVIKTVHP